ncbi:MAG: hypothetical protein UW46_C0008G0013 [Candidatus Yanofskybacteria bacterium GW2011_GWF1_44_227]|uniref:Cell division protein FtsL n=1 Tax=Candidatus Yanofskybacteria bacterium GW2011_GWE2_40_11 TaxID=1619033 RepID=A0A0G0QJF7_9BACT|nr:MAG: hypothetical protein UT69_C0003G0024 [Candidatus Yanofskybacteria bacterium GW2011_GWE1_40_10]KKR40243.1 MAG: hypothetical protein UT75_C0009G0016 [Candidatus Yanofskybacteria bacterium GW2011_GWE2_40_11]KKT15337.1 MAG: hypothetical protein UV97_C0009G0013 [Candidatus Yanofskybacteria bacterium GW2011_GWF2_43_596]KKT52981.1 MAG: hypothetical protein UW46_C0008G0013 [Candidatus Yanofskybacteria bacterium GW2011_GWF1_44_227]OGN36134.1 MAG: hypothetical protein A2241_00075 [Candidatus Yano
MPLPDQLKVSSTRNGLSVVGTRLSVIGENSAHAKEWALQNGYWFTINVVLVGLFVVMLLAYVMQMNVVTAGGYKVKLMNDKIVSLNESNAALMASKSSMEDQSAIISFANSNNMVEAKDSMAMFQSGGVALQR